MEVKVTMTALKTEGAMSQWMQAEVGKGKETDSF
jgi:hypothetical protein